MTRRRKSDPEPAEVPVEQTKTAGALISALREKCSLLVDAINPEKVRDATLPGIATALGTLIARVQTLESLTMITVDEMERREAEFADIVRRHVTDVATLEKIANDLARIGETAGRPDSPDDTEDTL